MSTLHARFLVDKRALDDCLPDRETAAIAPADLLSPAQDLIAYLQGEIARLQDENAQLTTVFYLARRADSALRHEILTLRRCLDATRWALLRGYSADELESQ
jgi:hypothetical protein